MFEANPTAAHYRDLRSTAERTSDWPRLRGPALERLRTAADDRPGVVDHLIAVLLDENEHDQAWQVATQHPDALHESRWHELIELRQHSNPAQVTTSNCKTSPARCYPGARAPWRRSGWPLPASSG